MTTLAAAHPEPWYRQRWPWLLMIAPAAAFFGGIVTMWIAFHTTDSLVVDDYYRQGKAINAQFARDRQALALGLRGTLEIDASGQSVVRLTSAQGAPLPATLELKVLHATLARLDRSVELVRGPDGAYRTSAPLVTTAPVAGKWRIQVEDVARQWRLVGFAQRFDQPVALGTPQ